MCARPTQRTNGHGHAVHSAYRAAISLYRATISPTVCAKVQVRQVRHDSHATSLMRIHSCECSDRYGQRVAHHPRNQTCSSVLVEHHVNPPPVTYSTTLPRRAATTACGSCALLQFTERPRAKPTLPLRPSSRSHAFPDMHHPPLSCGSHRAHGLRKAIRSSDSYSRRALPRLGFSPPVVRLLFRSSLFMRWNVSSSVAFVKTSATQQLVTTSFQVAI